MKKIAVFLGLALAGLVLLGYLPKELSDRLTRALALLLLLGFAIRAVAYFFS